MKTTAGTYVLEIFGTARDSSVNYKNTLILVIINLCDEVFTNGRGLYGVNLPHDVKYSNYDNIAYGIPSLGTDPDQPNAGTYTSGTVTTLDTWEETKYIIRAPLILPFVPSPYIMATVTLPRFEFADITYIDSRDGYDLRLMCPITYTTDSTYFDLLPITLYTAPSTPGNT